MHSNSTAKALISVRGQHVTYGLIRLSPLIKARSYDVEIEGFVIKRDGEPYPLDQYPLALAIPRNALNDVLFHTFEADDDIRQDSFEIELIIPDYDERLRISLCAAEDPENPERIVFNVEDDSCDWLPIQDINLADIMTPAFTRILEQSAMDQLSEHTMEHLPMVAES